MGSAGRSGAEAGPIWTSEGISISKGPPRDRGCQKASGLITSPPLRLPRPCHLLEVVDALSPPRRLACPLHRRQQQRDQDYDDRDGGQQNDLKVNAYYSLNIIIILYLCSKNQGDDVLIVAISRHDCIRSGSVLPNP